jgi:hypothetical protein
MVVSLGAAYFLAGVILSLTLLIFLSLREAKPVTPP